MVGSSDRQRDWPINWPQLTSAANQTNGGWWFELRLAGIVWLFTHPRQANTAWHSCLVPRESNSSPFLPPLSASSLTLTFPSHSVYLQLAFNSFSSQLADTPPPQPMHLIMSELSFLGELYSYLFSLSPFANWNNLHVAFKKSDFPTICWCKPPLFSNSPLVRTELSLSALSSISSLHIHTSMQMEI